MCFSVPAATQFGKPPKVTAKVLVLKFESFPFRSCKEKTVKHAKMITLVAMIFGVSQIAGAKEPTRRDQLRIAVQRICPVSGEKLGEHGVPIKVKVGSEGETVFFCCEDCLKGKIKDEHWVAIHADIARAQGICPVMKKPLPEDAKWTVVEGQIVYLCCPPCGKKITANPASYLKQIDDRYLNWSRPAEKK